MASSKFLPEPTTTSIIIPKKSDVKKCIDDYQEAADRWADRKAGRPYNKKKTTIHVRLSDLMEDLNTFCLKLEPGILNNQKLYELACLLQPLAEIGKKPEPFKNPDYVACSDLITQLKPLINVVYARATFDIIVSQAQEENPAINSLMKNPTLAKL